MLLFEICFVFAVVVLKLEGPYCLDFEDESGSGVIVVFVEDGAVQTGLIWPFVFPGLSFLGLLITK